MPARGDSERLFLLFWFFCGGYVVAEHSLSPWRNFTYNTAWSLWSLTMEYHALLTENFPLESGFVLAGVEEKFVPWFSIVREV